MERALTEFSPDREEIMKRIQSFIAAASVAILTMSAYAAQHEGKPDKGDLGAKAPEGAIILFDGSDLSGWQEGEKVGDLLAAGALTKDAYTDFEMHLEFNVNNRPDSDGWQDSGNSGVYIQQRYELQILDSYGRDINERDCGAIYTLKKPDVVVCKPVGEWQAYNIKFQAARFDDSGEKTENARITVHHNGVLIHDDYELPKKTGAGKPEGPDPRPIWLQNHKNPVVFRNIWIVPKESFRWDNSSADHQDLLLGDKKVLRYMHAAHDASTPARSEETYKVYHHVFDASGENLLTKGPGGKYTHHRGIFIGFNKMEFDGKGYDFWHMKNKQGERITQEHQEFIETSADENRASSTMLIHWNDTDGEPVIIERIEIQES